MTIDNERIECGKTLLGRACNREEGHDGKHQAPAFEDDGNHNLQIVEWWSINPVGDPVGRGNRSDSERLDCPACDHPGGSPSGLLSWVCENPECAIETFRVIDHPEPDPWTNTAGEGST